MGKVACSVSDDDMTTCVPPLDTRRNSVKGMSGLHQHSLPACLLSSLEYTGLTWDVRGGGNDVQTRDKLKANE